MTKYLFNERQILAEARKLRRRGVPWYKVAQRLRPYGVGEFWLRQRADPGYADKRRAYNCYRLKPIPLRLLPEEPPPLTQAQLRLRRKMPQDTRDLTARLMGDPLPGRSALDRMGLDVG